MEHSISKQTDWLKQQAKPIRLLQASTLCLRILQFSAQITSYWLFAGMMQTLLIAKQEVSHIQSAEFLFMALIWVASGHLAQHVSRICKNMCEQGLQLHIHYNWDNQQVALTRRFSHYFWQAIMLEHIPAVADYLSQYQLQKWLASLTPVIVLIAIYPVNYIVALGLLFTLPVVPLFMIIVGKGAAALHRKHFIALERLGDLFSDRLKGLTLITASDGHAEQSQRLVKASDAVNIRTMKVVSVAFLSSSVLDFFSTLSLALVAVFIGFTLLGEFSIGPSISFQQGLYLLLVAPLLFAEMKTLGTLYHQKAQAIAAAENIQQVLKSGVSTRANGQFTGINWINFKLKSPSIHAAKLNLVKGQWINLQGESGAGKTVFLEALMGFRESSHCLQGRCVMLTQSAVVLPSSLRQNLCMGIAHSDDALWRVLESVQLTIWGKSLPLGLDTLMGDYPPLSGGEAQRLALARILLQPSDIVLLDEPTAHLTDNQHQQLANLIRHSLKSKTVIWGSHKPLPEEWFNGCWYVAGGEVNEQ